MHERRNLNNEIKQMGSINSVSGCYYGDFISSAVVFPFRFLFLKRTNNSQVDIVLLELNLFFFFLLN